MLDFIKEFFSFLLKEKSFGNPYYSNAFFIWNIGSINTRNCSCSIYLYNFLKPDMTKIIGISAFYHDSAVALIEDGEILYASQEERFSRKKHDPGFPFKSLNNLFLFNKISLDDIDYVVFYEKPFLKFERLIETYLAFAPEGIKQFLNQCQFG